MKNNKFNKLAIIMHTLFKNNKTAINCKSTISSELVFVLIFIALSHCARMSVRVCVWVFKFLHADGKA